MKFFFLFLILPVLVFFSCKKEQGKPKISDNTLDYNEYNTYVKSVVFDSITGVSVANAEIYGRTPAYDALGNIMATTNLNGEYKGYFWWSEDPEIPDHRPNDSTDLYIEAVTNNRYGFVKFKAAMLLQNDTITIPNIYVKPIGYLKTHIKDTSGIDADVPLLEYRSLISPGNQLYLERGNSLDTIMLWKAYPGRNVHLTLSYIFNFNIYNNVVVKDVYILENDTASVNIFY